MTRRSTPQRVADEIAFPVRVLLRGVPGGFIASLGPGRNPADWIRVNLGLGNAEFYSWHTPYNPNGFQLLTRSLADAAAFMTAFPELRIADGTTAEFYNSPYVFSGRRRNE